MPFLPPNQQRQSTEDNRQRIDKYLDTRRPIATAADRVTTDHFQESQSQAGILPKLLLAYSCPTIHTQPLTGESGHSTGDLKI